MIKAQTGPGAEPGHPHSEHSDSRYEPPSHQRGAGDGTITLPGRCSLCDCALTEEGLCVDTLCAGSREDDDAYYRRDRRGPAPICTHAASAVELRQVRMPIGPTAVEYGERGMLVLEHGDGGATVARLDAKEADRLARRMRKLATDLAAAEAREGKRS